MAGDAVEVFFSYSHVDEQLKDQLGRHLSNLQRQGVISSWDNRQITAGTEWRGKIDAHLNSAQIILLLISPDFIASDYCYGVELERAMERHHAGEALVIPVLLRPTDWEDAPFAKLKPLPKNAKPIAVWPNQDEAFLDVVRELRKAVKERQQASKQSFKNQIIWTRRQLIKVIGFAGMGTGIGVGSSLLLKTLLQDDSPKPQRNSNSVTPSSLPTAASSLQIPNSPLSFKFKVIKVDIHGEKSEDYWDETQGFSDDLGNGVELDMVTVQGGSFEMGSSNAEPGRTERESPRHSVTVSAFAIGRYPVTQAQ